MNLESASPPKYVETTAEVYLSYTTNEGIEIVDERVFLDIAVEIVNPRLHLYDVIDKWVLALPGAYHELPSTIHEDLINWRKFIEVELKGTERLEEMKVLNRCSKPCRVKLKNRHGTSKFNSYLTRNLYSLADEGIYALEANTIVPIVYPGTILEVTEKDYANPDSYLSLVQPLLWDVRVLAEQGYAAPPKSYVVAKHKNKIILRLLCSGGSIRDLSTWKKGNINYFYTLTLKPLKNALIDILNK